MRRGLLAQADCTLLLGGLLSDCPAPTRAEAEAAYRVALDAGIEEAERGRDPARELGRRERVVAGGVQREARSGAGDLEQAAHRAVRQRRRAAACRTPPATGRRAGSCRAACSSRWSRSLQRSRTTASWGPAAAHREDRAHLGGGGEVELAPGDDQVAAVDGVVVEGEHVRQRYLGLPAACCGRGRACLISEGGDVAPRPIERVDEGGGRLAAVERAAVAHEQVLGRVGLERRCPAAADDGSCARRWDRRRRRNAGRCRSTRRRRARGARATSSARSRHTFTESRSRRRRASRARPSGS